MKAKGFKIIVQARMGSKRLPGKILTQIDQKPLIQHLIDSLKQAFNQDQIIIASSLNSENDPLEIWCNEMGLDIYRGDEENVAQRFKNIVERFKLSCFIRISADSPLIDYRLLNKAIDIFNTKKPDIVSTVGPKKFPSGLNVEVVDANLFQSSYASFTHHDHFEHVTKYFYENERDYDIQRMECDIPFTLNDKFAIDTQEDFNRVEALFKVLTKDHFQYTFSEKLEIMQKMKVQ